MYQFIHNLLLKVYLAMALVWLGIAVGGFFKEDPNWSVNALTELAPYTLCLVAVACVHWYICYRKEFYNGKSN